MPATPLVLFRSQLNIIGRDFGAFQNLMRTRCCGEQTRSGQTAVSGWATHVQLLGPPLPLGAPPRGIQNFDRLLEDKTIVNQFYISSVQSCKRIRVPDIMTVSSNPAPRKINLLRIAHVYYTHKNIVKAREFLEDFGFEEISKTELGTYYRGSGSEPFVYCAKEGESDSFGGAAFVVENADDLEYASKNLPHATAVQELVDEPGGGLRVTFRDPVDGFPFHLLYGQTPVAKQAAAHDKIQFNFVSKHDGRAECSGMDISH